jgi:alpha-tubulin suppressor-like RCC1 family protein
VSRTGLYALLEVPRPVATVIITPPTATVERGETLQLSATVRAADGDVLSGRSVTWRSSNDAVATVSASGLVTAVAAGGPITVTAESEGQRGTTTLTITRTIRFERVFTGAFNSCALTGDGEAWCWGANEYCETGVQPCTEVVLSPTRVPTALRFRELLPGNEFACGLALDGAAWCWGRNDRGELGTGNTTNSMVPVAVTGGHRFVSLRGVFEHVCGLTADGVAWCWGSNTRGQLGVDDDPRSSATPGLVRGSHRFVQLEVGEEHSCGLTATGEAWCWGENSDGESGDGSGIDRFAPVAVAGSHRFVELSLGSFHSCGRTATGDLWCWGWNREGQIGSGNRISQLTPVRVNGGEAFASVHAFGWSTCVLLADGASRCWGENAEGELGNGATTDVLVPTNTLGARRFRALTRGGAFHMCGRALDDMWSCWGWNEWAQLGDGTRVNRLSPIPLQIPQATTRVAPTAAANAGPQFKNPRSRADTLPPTRSVPRG